MKHALSAALILLTGALAGCAEHEATGAREVHYSYATGWVPQTPQAAAMKPANIATSALPAHAREGRRESLQLTPEQTQRNARRVYAEGLERILLSNGVSVSVVVYEGQVGPTPTLMFFGHFSREFVSSALTRGAVLERARELGFKSVDFFDRGPEGHYQFVLSRTAPLPKCAAYQRLCL